MGLDVWLLLSAGVVIAAVVAVRVAHWSGLPSLLIFLGFGVLLGESGLGLQFENPELAQQIGLIALAIILAEGGLTTTWSHVKGAIPTALVLATVGVGVSIAAVAISVHLILDLDWRTALLLGAILASTDAAAVFSVLRRLPLPPRLAGILEAESGFNDAPTVIAVMLLSAATSPSLGVALFNVLFELVVGTAVGLAVGPLGIYALRRMALPVSGLYPIAVLALAFVAYAGAVLLHGSGFLAIYLATLVMGNSRMPHRAASRGFAEGVAWLAQIGLFVMLGILVSPSEMPAAVVPGLVAGLILVAVARPLSIMVSAFLTRLMGIASLNWREQAFLSWAGLRGAVPIVLATIPWAATSIENSTAKLVFNEVFVIVVVYTLLQGPTLPFVAKLLGLSTPDEARDLEVESAPLEELNADLLQVKVPPTSKLQGVEIFELRLPRDAQVTLIVRDGRTFVPTDSTRIRVEDQLLVVTTAACRDMVERRMRAISRKGKLAGWFGERGV
ncbi:potassium/proton antiporter [Streptosporangium sp. NBC_01755]|uniref:potassium/proton antiporter n=1 Tax=unclassified Streptosporangium TaxID=2632669 RepID=UPI002DD837F8|nr:MULTISPECIES: potassium/proton antiporter [unclassified Streptosporangium]WSA26009.1 potassium/proton antiporter [Streptosporangium sp. NBC_01810]WSD02569.1 potassium/proton antiporter [Streptosporangium sp. NBC_01755]